MNDRPSMTPAMSEVLAQSVSASGGSVFLSGRHKPAGFTRRHRDAADVLARHGYGQLSSEEGSGLPAMFTVSDAGRDYHKEWNKRW